MTSTHVNCTLLTPTATEKQGGCIVMASFHDDVHVIIMYSFNFCRNASVSVMDGDG